MEERIIDDVMGRGIRLKKTKDGYTDVTDELAPETEEEEIVEEISVILPEGQDEERILESSVTPMEADDEELVDLSPEEADRVRAKKETERILRQETYKKMCDEGEKLLQTQSYKAAELAYEKALQYDELATQASVGYWRAKTANFTDPDVLVEEYLEEGMEELEYDLGVLAVETIKKEFHANFEKRYEELTEQEAPYLEEVTKKQTARRQVLTKRRIKTGILCGASILPFLVGVIATIYLLMMNFKTVEDAYLIPTIIAGGVSLLAFFGMLIGINQFFNACRMYRMNEDLSSTEEGKAVLEIRAYKKIYEELLILPTETEEEEDTQEE